MRRLDLSADTARADLEPLVLSDPEAQRAVMDFQRADAAGDGEVLPSGAAPEPPASRAALARVAHAPRPAPPDFARVFGLDDDLYLRRLEDLFDTTGSGSVCLAEFLGGRSSPRAVPPPRARRFQRLSSRTR